MRQKIALFPLASLGGSRYDRGMNKNKNESVMINLVKTEDGLAYDVTIQKETATLWQYIKALDDFLEEKVAPCLGCDSCCYQRIPLTLPDIYGYAGREKESIANFLRQHAEICKKGFALDIQLRQGEDGICTFLDGEEQRCTDHSHRSLVCHTYICLPQTGRARKMREYLINEGEDALAGALFQMGLCDQWRDLQENYPLKPQWQNKTYEEIFLKNVLTSDLWEILTAPSSLEIIG